MTHRIVPLLRARRLRIVALLTAVALRDHIGPAEGTRGRSRDGTMRWYPIPGAVRVDLPVDARAHRALRVVLARQRSGRHLPHLHGARWNLTGHLN
jgi:hypothetical protein